MDIDESKRYSKKYIEDFLIKWKIAGNAYIPGSYNNMSDPLSENFGLEAPANAPIFRPMLTDIPKQTQDDTYQTAVPIDPKSNAADRNIEEISDLNAFLEKTLKHQLSVYKQIKMRLLKPNLHQKNGAMNFSLLTINFQKNLLSQIQIRMNKNHL